MPGCCWCNGIKDVNAEDSSAVHIVQEDAEIYDSPEVACFVITPEVLTLKDVARLQDKSASETAELFNVTLDDALLLLRYHKWSEDALSEAFFADPECVQRASGVRCHDCAPPRPPDGQCGICYTDPPIAVLPCGHSSYCGGCWAEYVRTAVEGGKGCLDLACPTSKCNERLRPSHVRRFCPRELFGNYERFLLESFVDVNPALAWCPGRGCDRACQVPASSTPVQVQCPCGAQWCSRCREDAHRPVSCDVVGEWKKKNTKERHDMLWIAENTKPCPKCKNPIEKNGGCMHMTCRPPGGCKHEFCWICMGPWKGHTTCNKYAGAEASSTGDGAGDLQRYAHFFKRFHAHEKAQEYANVGQREAMSALTAAYRFDVMDAEFLDVAVNEIVSCRRFLKWTYAHAYIVGLGAKAHSQQLFEFQQSQLEETLESLSHIMETVAWSSHLSSASPPAQDFYTSRHKVLSLLRVLRASFDSLSLVLRDGDG